MRKNIKILLWLGLLSTVWALAQTEPPLNDTFENELVSVQDDFGNDVGFTTWGDAPGNVTLARLEVPADSDLALPDQEGNNYVLELTRNIASWGGFTHAFEKDGAWVGRGLSGYEGLSFRYYGTSSGETVFVEVFDNRSSPQGDSAERYEYSFDDDFSGWNTFEIPFTDFRRRSDFQPAGAPNDGLGLTESSGYAFRYGPSSTPVYLDDVTVYGSSESAAGEAEQSDALQLSFSRPSFEVKEGEAATLTVRLNKASEAPVSVRYTLAPDTATAYRDYAGSSDLVVFAPGVTGYRFELPQESGGTLYVDALRSVRSLSGEVYLDPAQSVAARVADLLGRLTLAEKVGQMTQIDVTRLMGNDEWDRGPLNEAWLQRILVDNRVGSLLSGGGAAPVPNTPRAWAELTNSLQRYALENARLPIPLLYGVDAVHGHNNVLGATVYPHNLGLAATFDPDLAATISDRVAADLLATGTPWTFAPVADVGRDPRWGRFYETFGEDPYLASAFVAASVRGFQASGKVAATVKHFGGYSQTLVGFDRSPAFLDLRTLRTVHFPAFRAGLDAGADTVMANSGSVNGVPGHASKYLLTDVLRGEFGFDGVTVSDWNDIDKLVTVHKVAATFKDAVAMSINAGVDMYMVPHDADTFTSTLTELVTEGAVAEARIDEAVGRILALKFKLGLFEQPYVDADAADAVVIERDRALARRAAAESLTLLEQGPLPFDETVKNILLVGESADSLANQMGGWTIGWQGVPDSGEVPPGTTVLEAMQGEAPVGVTVDYLADTRNAAAVAAAARAADVVVAVAGETPYAEGEGDSATLQFPDDQLGLLRTLVATDTPVVAVILAGRPLILPEDIRTGLGSLVMAYLPGSEGGAAVADLLYGRINPSGKLPFSWPKHTGQLPLTYDVLPGAPYDPLYPFGYGLSYTRFAQRKLGAELGGDTVKVSLELENSGDLPGSEAVQVYASRPPAGVLTPVKQLVGFAKVRLEPGEAQTVSISIPVKRLAVIPGDLLGEAEAAGVPGRYTFTVGKAQVQVDIP